VTVAKGERAGQVVFGITSLGFSVAAGLSSAQAQDAKDGATAKKQDNLETVKVTARRSSLDILTEQIHNTAQSIDVIPLQVIQEQGTTNLQEALKNVPGITLNAGEGGAHGDQVNLRGFSASDDFFLDGLRDTGFYTRDPFDYQGIEVYKGPASTLFGRGSTGGVVNQVTKKPQTYPIDDISVALGSHDEIRGTADINYVTGDDSALRVNLMGQSSHYDGRPFARTRRWGVAPSFSAGIGGDTTFTVEYLHQQEDNVPDFGIPFLFGKPAPVPHNAYYGLPDDDRQKTDVDILTGHIDHKFNDIFSLTDTARFGRYWFDTRQTSPTYGDANCFDAPTPPYPGAPLCSNTADPNPVTLHDPLYPVLGTPLDQIFVLRDRPSEQGTITTYMNELDLNAKFQTGPLAHTLVFGLEVDREVGDLERLENQDDIILPTPLLNPDPFESFPGHQIGLEGKPQTTTTTVGVFAIDSIALGPHWNLVGALRYDHFGADFNDTVDVAHYTHDDNIVSPRAALVYKPDENSTVYFSYGTSFNPAASNLSLASSNNDLAPEKDRSFELGGKIVVLDGLLSLAAAVFDTKLSNARTADPEDPGEQSFAGTERVKGFEFTANGHITPNWEIIAGYTYLDTRDQGSAGPDLIGPIPNTAPSQANLWSVYDFDNGLRLGGGLNYLGERAAGFDTETVPGRLRIAHIPSYITLDAMVGYRLTDNLDLQLNVDNLANRYYFTSSYFNTGDENHVVPGQGRTFLLTANVSL
jgi:catecholate siderophore receptor